MCGCGCPRDIYGFRGGTGDPSSGVWTVCLRVYVPAEGSRGSTPSEDFTRGPASGQYCPDLGVTVYLGSSKPMASLYGFVSLYPSTFPRSTPGVPPLPRVPTVLVIVSSVVP